MATKDRGFIAEWKPRRDTECILRAVELIISEYRDELPLTVRQIFYRLVARFDYEKTEAGYKALVGYLTKARRVQRFSFDWIRDDGAYGGELQTYADADHVISTLKSIARNAQLDRQTGQGRQIVLWAEARGMVPTIEQIAGEYGVPVYSSGGFDSVTAKHNFAKRIAYTFDNLGLHTTVLHVGDYDPSGVTMFNALAEDIWYFAEGMTDGCDPEFERIALTPEQIAEHNLPTAPAKKSTHNASFVGDTVQLEALDPRTLRQIVEDQIRSRFDLDVYEGVLQREVDVRADVLAQLQR